MIEVFDLRLAPHWIFSLAQWHFDHWGPLTGAESLNGYVEVLTHATTSEGLPRVLIAAKDEELLGSVNLVACDCQLYPDLTPWLAQLFVTPNARTQGVGRVLVQTAEREARALGFFNYLGKERMLMERDLRATEIAPDCMIPVASGR